MSRTPQGGYELGEVRDEIRGAPQLCVLKSTFAVGEQAAETHAIRKARTSSKPLRFCTQGRLTNVPLSLDGSAAPALLSSGVRRIHLRVAAAVMMAFE